MLTWTHLLTVAITVCSWASALRAVAAATSPGRAASRGDAAAVEMVLRTQLQELDLRVAFDIDCSRVVGWRPSPRRAGRDRSGCHVLRSDAEGAPS